MVGCRSDQQLGTGGNIVTGVLQGHATGGSQHHRQLLAGTELGALGYLGRCEFVHLQHLGTGLCPAFGIGQIMHLHHPPLLGGLDFKLLHYLLRRFLDKLPVLGKEQ